MATVTDITRDSTRRPTPARRARRGFTLIELITVLVLISIIARFAIPRINVTQYRVDTATRITRDMLQYAQRLAILRQHDIIISFDETNQRVRLVEDKDSDGTVDPGERIVWRALEHGIRFQQPSTGISGAVTSAVAGADVRTVDAMRSAIFHRDGSLNTQLEIYITSPRAKPKDWRAVSVVKATARTAWFRHNGSGWAPASL